MNFRKRGGSVTGNCDANRIAWVALIQMINNNPLLDYQKFDGVPTIYYSVLNQWARTQGIFLGADQQVGAVALDCVEQYCLQNRLPDMTALVVRKDTKLPGEDFFVQHGIPLTSPSQLRPQWLAIAATVVQQRARYPIGSPADLCKYGNCVE